MVELAAAVVIERNDAIRRGLQVVTANPTAGVAFSLKSLKRNAVARRHNRNVYLLGKAESLLNDLTFDS
jgi:hypothetical protein